MALGDEIEAAKRHALRMLARRGRSEAEVRRALERAGFEPPAVEGAVARLVELRFLDDAALARSRAESLLAAGRLSPGLVAQRLRAQGIGEPEADAAVEQARGRTTERELVARALASRRPPVGRDSPREERVRAARSLAARGFSEEELARALGLDGTDGD